MSTMQPLGLATALARGSAEAGVVSSVERTDSGDSLISVGTVSIFRSGDLSRVRESAVLRLTAAEREELIARLMEHRFADLTANLGSEGGQR